MDKQWFWLVILVALNSVVGLYFGQAKELADQAFRLLSTGM